MKVLRRALLALTASAAVAAPALGQSEDWAAIARQDVLAAYDIYLASHAGVHDPANPGFAAQLARARDEALRRAGTAASHSDYAEALGAFTGVLEDGHATVSAKPPAEPASTARRPWPGFVAAWRGGLFVHHAGEGSPAPAGSAILGCDGVPAERLIAERVRSRGFRASEPGQYWSRAAQAFAPSLAFAHTRPETCTFRLPGGEEREARLDWMPAPDNLLELMALARDGELTPVGVGEPRPGLFLIGMPTFQPDEAGAAAYRALYEALAERREEINAGRALVIDLRHNGGGSSNWPHQAAALLWGREAVERRMAHHFRDVAIWWRASADNAAHAAVLEEQMRREGNASFAEMARMLGLALQAAVAQGQPYFVQPGGERGEGDPAAPTDFAVPVYVITSGTCASACLDALDIFTRFENVKLIGAPTSADTTYMEVRAQDLPSGKGRIVVPVKLWAGRPRGSGEVYRPHIAMTALDWPTAAFLDRIEADLAGE